jgi:serine/threonine protein kinase
MSRCPDDLMLQSYILGDLPLRDETPVERHLDECATCQSTLDAFDAALNARFAPLRLAAKPSQPEPSLDRLIEQAKRCAPTTLVERETVGVYTLLEMIGSGGMGCVYRAEHRHLKKIVALKVLAPALLRSAPARERFRREVEVIGQLASPHIVAAFDAGEHEGRDFLAMEFVEGQNLADHVQQFGPLPVDDALDAAMQAASGLHDAHMAGIIHRDVKPSNLLRTPPGTIKLLDLGLARLKEPTETDGHRTDSQAIMGTAHYMAPEQAINTRDADEQADVYALGCTLFFLLTGRPPYAGETPMEILVAHREQPIPAVPSLRPEVQALLAKLMAKDPRQRPSSMAATLLLLDRARQQLRQPRRRRVLPALVGATLAACVLAGLFVWSQQPPSSSIDVPKKPVVNGKMSPAIDLALVPAGEFRIGSPDTDPVASFDEKPRQKVKINRPFRLGKTEITQAQFEEVMGTNPSAFHATGRFKDRVAGKDTRSHPVDSLSWLEAVRFCNKLSEKHGIEPYYVIDNDKVTIRGGTGFRLPTEAEWEYACRAGSDATYPFGEKKDELTEHAWFADNAGDATHPVGLKKANAFGLFDMLGNVPEWCWDRYDPKFYERMPSSDPAGPGVGEVRVYRGGAWNHRAPQLRPASRNALGNAYDVLTIVGLRVARNTE